MCVPCRVPMTIERCETGLRESILMVVTYRYAECGLLERAQIQYSAHRERLRGEARCWRARVRPAPSPTPPRGRPRDKQEQGEERPRSAACNRPGAFAWRAPTVPYPQSSRTTPAYAMPATNAPAQVSNNNSSMSLTLAMTSSPGQVPANPKRERELWFRGCRGQLKKNSPASASAGLPTRNRPSSTAAPKPTRFSGGVSRNGRSPLGFELRIFQRTDATSLPSGSTRPCYPDRARVWPSACSRRRVSEIRQGGSLGVSYKLRSKGLEPIELSARNATRRT